MNPLQQIMGIKEASQQWGMTPEEVQKLCKEGQVQAVCLDGEDGLWVILKDQPAPDSRKTTKAAPPAKPFHNKTSSMSTRLRDALYE